MTGNSAWNCEDHGRAPEECYLHNFLPEMPDLNLRNDFVRSDLEVGLQNKNVK